VGEGLDDILAPQLEVVFCGINPGLAAAAQGHHFAGRFWRTLHLAGFTSLQLQPEHDRMILHYGCGLTAVVQRPTARVDQLSAREFAAAAVAFEQKIAGFAPRFVAFLARLRTAPCPPSATLPGGRSRKP
jgi:TDG/mug DNA glycosylase family protein